MPRMNSQPVIGSKVKMVGGTENRIRKIGAMATIKCIDEDGSFSVTWDSDGAFGGLWIEPPVGNIAHAYGLPIWFKLLTGDK